MDKEMGEIIGIDESGFSEKKLAKQVDVDDDKKKIVQFNSIFSNPIKKAKKSDPLQEKETSGVIFEKEKDVNSK